MFQPFLQGAELCLDGLCFLIFQRDDLTAVIADLLLLSVESGFNPLDDVEEVIVLVSQQLWSTLIYGKTVLWVLSCDTELRARIGHKC